MRIGLGVASLALVALGACGGGSEDATTAETSAPATVSLADTCPKLAKSLSEMPDGLASASDYTRLGNDIQGMIGEVDPKGLAVLTGLRESVAAVKAGVARGASGSDLLDLRAELRDSIGRVDGVCAQLGSPLG